MSKKKISVVIPIYNEEENILSLIEELSPILKSHYDGEIIVVDDCSTDNGATAVFQYAENVSLEICLIKHQHRLGQSACLYTGIKNAKYECIVTLDGDGQNDPKDIINLKKIWDKESLLNNDLLIIGNRIKRKDTFSKRFASKFALFMRKIFLKDSTPDTGCGVKIFDKSLFLSLPYFDHIHRFMPALVRRQGGKVISFPVSHRARFGGRSKYSNLQRSLVGFFDLWGVFWLIRRSPFPIKVEDVLVKKKKEEE